MKFIHYFKVACHFWPWQYEFWLGLFHDAKEDGWHDWPIVWEYFCYKNSLDIDSLSRKKGENYFAYIERVRSSNKHVRRVKVADLLVNYKRAWPSLRKRYAKALLILADN